MQAGLQPLHGPGQFREYPLESLKRIDVGIQGQPLPRPYVLLSLAIGVTKPMHRWLPELIRQGSGSSKVAWKRLNLLPTYPTYLRFLREDHV
jgi:hypothetical protein